MVHTRDSYIKSLSDYKTSMNDIKYQVIELRQENLQCHQQLEQCKQKLSKKEDELKLTVNDLKELQSNYGNLEDVCQDCECALQKAQRENSISCETICRLEKQLSDSEKEIFELKKHLESYEYQLSHLEKEYHVMLTTNQSNEDFYNKAQEKQTLLRDQLKDLEVEKTENEIKIKELLEIIEYDQAKRNALQQNLEISEQQVNSLTAENAELCDKNSKLRSAKQKLKVLAEELKAHEAALSKAEGVKFKLQKTEEEKKAAVEELDEVKNKYAAQCEVVTKLNTEVDELRDKKKRDDVQLHLLTATQTTLNKSIDDLETSNEFKSEKIKNLEDERRKKMVVFEKLVGKLKNTVKRLELDLEMTRCELKERRKDVSELKHENLEKEFQIQSMERELGENAILIEARGKENDIIAQRNEELSKQMCMIKEHQKLWVKTNEEKKQHETDESAAMMKLMTDIKCQREKNLKADQESVIVEQKQKIEELEHLWREEQSNARAEKLEKSYLKEELDRIRVKNRSKLMENKKESSYSKNLKYPH